jgi:RNA polymerase sigma-70 factor (ECF subfamily)
VIQSLEATVRIEGLVSRVQNGEQEAFTLLYHEYFRQIYRYVYLRVGKIEQAEDLTQEVFLKALEGIGSYRSKGAPFGSWLFRIAHNTVVDYYRRSKNGLTLIAEPVTAVAADDPVGTTEKKMEAQAIQKAIEALPPRQREVISLRFGSSMSIAETAESIGATIGTVKKLQYEALAKLRRLVGHEPKK